MKWSVLFIFVLQMSSCVSDKKEGIVVSDATLVSKANGVSSFTYYKNSTDTLVTDPSSEHGLYMRVRFDPRASSAMKDSMSALNGSVFPDESMIVKEMYDTRGGPLTGFVIMYKLHMGADNNYAWLWGEYKADGTPIYSVSKKGDRCIACHSQISNSDLVRTFSLH